MTDLSGRRFGRWTVLECASSKGAARWKCRCDCGTERTVLARNLLAGISQSCGCLGREKLRAMQKKDLTGRQFGKLTVLEEADAQQTGGCRWKCRCLCGRECVVSARSLQTGRRTSCGCDSKKGKHRARNVAGQRFGMLTALYPTKQRGHQGSVIWHCRCNCGGEIDAALDHLQSGAIISCGCAREQCDKALAHKLTHIAGTSIDLLRSEKLRRDNQTGVTGVYQKRGRYAATIRFQGRTYYLGSYERLEDAATVRRRAAEELHKSTVAFYDAWKRQAEKNPAWAQENPIQIQVEKRDDGEFSVKMSPDMSHWQ